MPVFVVNHLNLRESLQTTGFVNMRLRPELLYGQFMLRIAIFKQAQETSSSLF